MTSTQDLVTTYLRLLEDPASDPAALEALLDPEVEQIELPNALNPRGQRSDRADILRRFTLGKQMLSAQRYTVTHLVDAGNQVVVEADWRGTMAITAGPLAAGQTLEAQFCMVFELRDGRIWRQRNYDCFRPFS